MQISRRGLLAVAAGIAGSSLLPRVAFGQERIVNVLSHRVHQGVANGPAGSITAEWEAANDAQLDAVRW